MATEQQLRPVTESRFANKHHSEIDELAQRLKAYLAWRDRPEARSGLQQVTAEWNAALTEGEHDKVNLKGLEDTYRWLSELAAPNPAFLDELAGFMARCQRASSSRPGSQLQGRLDGVVENVGRALSAITTGVELEMPEDVYRSAKGDVTVAWTTGDAILRWTTSKERPLSLRGLAQPAFVSSGGFSTSDSTVLTAELVEEIRSHHRLCLPSFSYPPELKPDRPPDRLLWSEHKAGGAAPRSIPDWLEQRKLAPFDLPTEAEVDVFSKDARLADLADQLVCAAATEDFGQAQGAKAVEQRSSGALESLVTAVAERAGSRREEVAALFLPRLMSRQEKTKGPQECAANTAALAFLLASLTES